MLGRILDRFDRNARDAVREQILARRIREAVRTHQTLVTTAAADLEAGLISRQDHETTRAFADQLLWDSTSAYDQADRAIKGK